MISLSENMRRRWARPLARVFAGGVSVASFRRTTIVPFADAFGRLQPKKEAAGRIDVVIFEVKALQPRIVPGEIFRLP